MKKYSIWLCMIICMFGLSSCGNNDVQMKASTVANQKDAEVLTKDIFIPYMESQFAETIVADAYIQEYNIHEIESLIGDDIEMLMKDNQRMEPRSIHLVGNSLLAGIKSFSETFQVIGTIERIQITKNIYVGDEIHIEALVTGEKGNATAVFIYADDIFLTLESIALNQNQTMSELLQKAVYDTLMGMGSVFFVLVLISSIISTFRFIPKILEKKKKEEEVKGVSPTNIETVESVEELVNDTELVAVIAAAIAASEGHNSTDGFYVRSIRKAKK